MLNYIVHGSPLACFLSVSMSYDPSKLNPSEMMRPFGTGEYNGGVPLSMMGMLMPQTNKRTYEAMTAYSAMQLPNKRQMMYAGMHMPVNHEMVPPMSMGAHYNPAMGGEMKMPPANMMMHMNPMPRNMLMSMQPLPYVPPSHNSITSASVAAPLTTVKMSPPAAPVSSSRPIASSVNSAAVVNASDDSGSVETSAGDSAKHPVTKRARHNATERRRVRKVSPIQSIDSSLTNLGVT